MISNQLGGNDLKLKYNYVLNILLYGWKQCIIEK